MYSFLIPEEFYRPENPHQIDFSLNFKYDLSLTTSCVDSRGEYSKEVAAQSSNKQIEVSYDHNLLSVSYGNRKESLQEFLNKNDIDEANSILFDATNLAFPEIAIVLRAALTNSKVNRVGFIYSEPASYLVKVTTPLETRGYDLSSKINKLDFIPKFYNHSNSENSAYLLAFLGFEYTRLARLIDPDETEPFKHMAVCIAAPPFQTGWEMHALMAHSHLLEKIKIDDTHFVPGNQPYETYKKIGFVKKANSNLTLAPFGTKPMSIAAALAAAEDETISVIFDFPTKKKDRSTGIGNTHHYGVLVK